MLFFTYFFLINLSVETAPASWERDHGVFSLSFNGKGVLLQDENDVGT